MASKYSLDNYPTIKRIKESREEISQGTISSDNHKYSLDSYPTIKKIKNGTIEPVSETNIASSRNVERITSPVRTERSYSFPDTAIPGGYKNTTDSYMGEALEMLKNRKNSTSTASAGTTLLDRARYLADKDVWTAEERSEAQEMWETQLSPLADANRNMISSATYFGKLAKRNPEWIELRKEIDNKLRVKPYAGDPSKYDTSTNSDTENKAYEEAGRKDPNNPLVAAENTKINIDMPIKQVQENVLNYTLMTDDEKAQYNTIYGMYGREQAEEYKKSIQEDINQRIAQYRTENDPNLQHAFGRTLYMFGQGAESAVKGLSEVAGWATRHGVQKPVSANEYIASDIRNDEDNNAVENVIYDIAQSTGYMAPGIAAGGVAGALGASASAAGGIGNTLFGLSQAGNAWREDISEGQDVNKAWLHGLQQGIDETATNWLLGGINAFGGNAVKRFAANKGAKEAITNGIDKIAKSATGRTLLRRAADALSDMGSEAAQEYVQFYTENITRNVLYGEDNSVNPLDPEAWYSAALGALNAGLLNAPNYAAKYVVARTGDISEAKAVAESIDTDRSHYANDEDFEKAKNLKDVAEEVAAKNDAGTTTIADKAAYNEALAGVISINDNAYDYGEGVSQETIDAEVKESTAKLQEMIKKESAHVTSESTPEEAKDSTKLALEMLKNTPEAETANANADIPEVEELPYYRDDIEHVEQISNEKRTALANQISAYAGATDGNIHYQLSKSRSGYSGYITKTEGNLENARHIYDSPTFNTSEEAVNDLLDVAEANGLINVSDNTVSETNAAGQITQLENGTAAEADNTVIDQPKSGLEEITRRADVRFKNNEDAHRVYTESYSGQDIVDYDEYMSKAYEGGRREVSLRELAGKDSGFNAFSAENLDAVDAIWKAGYNDRIVVDSSSNTVETGGNTNGKGEVGEVHNEGILQQSDELGTEPDRGHGEVRSEENSVLQGDGRAREHTEGNRGDDDGNVPEVSGQRNGGRRSEGISEGDQVRVHERGSRGVTEDSVEKPDRKPRGKKAAKAEADEKIDIASQPEPKGTDYVITSASSIPSTENARINGNVNAIKALKTIMEEGRIATSEEQKILAKYTGWGGISDAQWKKTENILKDVLTEDELKTARASLLDAYYTDPELIRGIYNGLKSIGFNGGRMLEPSAGVGRFIGAMPKDLLNKVKSWTAVEIDTVTGNIAKYLYPNADVRVQGFEEAKLVNDYMDAVIGNVPFGNSGIADRRYPKNVTSKIHNYFIARSLDTVRPGGIACLITTSGTLDSQNSAVRRYFMSKADLIGAIRLPNTAFKGSGTNVITDILVFKKRADGTPYNGEQFLNAGDDYRYIDGRYVQDTENEYFKNHPEMVLGTKSSIRGQYNNELTYNPDTSKPLGKQIEQAFKRITTKMDYPTVDNHREAVKAVRTASNNKVGTAYKKDGKLYINDKGIEKAVNLSEKQAAIYSEAVDIRDTARALTDAMYLGYDESRINVLRKKLNTQYDSFVKKNKGGFHNSTVRSVLKNDSDYAFLQALEIVKDKEVTKNAIFYRNTVKPVINITSVDNINDAIDVSIDQLDRIDTAKIAELMHEPEASVIKKLDENILVFRDRDGNFVSSDTYLSGNVRAKLKEAEALVEADPAYKKNVKALRAVLPEYIKGPDISVQMGVTWVPAEYYGEFAAHLMGAPADAVTVTYNAYGGYSVDARSNLYYRAENTSVWGNKNMPFLYESQRKPGMLFNILNNKDLTVAYKDNDGNRIVDQAATEALKELKSKINDEFNKWLWEDAERRATLEEIYNDSFNAMARPKYSGEGLTIAGQAAGITLRNHQSAAINRIVRSPYNTLLQHGAGAGKTYAMIGAAMKLRQLGIAKKPVIVVPKNKIDDWRNDFYTMFPNAKILVADDTTFAKDNRRVFTNKIATSDIDAVIMSKEQFQYLPMTDDFQKEFYQKELDSILMAEEEERANRGQRQTTRQLELRKKQIEKRLKELGDSKKDSDNISFEQTGIDYVFVDEAQAYKNLAYTTNLTNVADMGAPDGNKITYDMLMKTNYLRGIQKGKGVVFGTATPVMNSPVEAYTMLRYLCPEELEKRGIRTLDNFINMFGRIEGIVRQDAVGRSWVIRNSFTGFINMPEWQQLWGMVTDRIRTEDVPGIKLPKLKGGDRNVIVCQAGDYGREVINGLGDRLKRADKKGENHIFALQSDGKKASFSQRLLDPSLPYGPQEKVPIAVNEIYKIWKSSKTFKDIDGNTQKNGVQLVFCDYGVPKTTSTSVSETTEASESNPNAEVYDSRVNVYQDMKDMLIAKGVPANEIAFIHDAKNDKQRAELFAKVRSGSIRVLIGSSRKMGEGLNVQDRVVAMHEMNPLARPGDIEQVEARGIRQGNLSPEVQVNVYVTEDTFDTKMWDNLRAKSKFISEITSGEYTGRNAEFSSDEFGATAGDIMAVSSGNPLLKEQADVNDKVRRLENLEKAHNNDVYIARVEIDRANKAIARNKDLIPKYKADIKRITDISGDKFNGVVNGKTFTKRDDFGSAVIAAVTKAINSSSDETVKIGNIGGLDMYAMSSNPPMLELRGSTSYSVQVNIQSASGTVTRITNTLTSIDKKLSEAERIVKDSEANIPKLKEVAASEFARKDELEAARKEAEAIQQQLLKGTTEDSKTTEEDEVLSRRTGKSRVIDKDTPIAERKERLVSYIKRVLSGQPTKKFEIVDPDLEGKLADDISDAVGFDVHGFEVRLSRDEIMHVDKRHGAEGEHDVSFEEPDKLAFLVDLNNSNSNISVSDEYDYHYRNSDNSPSQKVVIETRLNDGTYSVVEAVPDNRNKAVYVISAYKTKEAGSEERNANALHITSKTYLPHAASNDEARSGVPNTHGALGLTSETKLPHNASVNNNIPQTGDNNKQKAIKQPVGHPEDWDVKLAKGNDKKPMRLSDIIAKINHKYGINITVGHIRGAGVAGEFNTRDKGIKTKIANDIPTIAHEFGHWVDDKYEVTNAENLSDAVKEDLRKALKNPEDYKDTSVHLKEGFAEFMRAFLTNPETACIDYPELSVYFLKKLPPKDLAEIKAFAYEVNASLALDAGSAASSIRLQEDSQRDYRTLREKASDTFARKYQDFVDSNYGIRRMDYTTGGNSYIIATNAAYSNARVDQILFGDLRDIDGKYVSPGLKTALHGINIGNATEYEAFGEYLVVQHGQEYLEQGKRVFADDRKNSTFYMQNRAAELESKYPAFKEAADRLYTFIENFMMTYAVDTGLISRDSYAKMKRMYPKYVPFFRADIDEGKGGKNNKRPGGNALKRAKGSGRDIINPVDNVITAVTNIVNRASYNNVFLHMADDSIKLGTAANFMERIPDELIPKRMDIRPLKAELVSNSTSLLADMGISDDVTDAMASLIDGMGDIMVQFDIAGMAKRNEIIVLRNGKKEFWKINDPLLLDSIASMDYRTRSPIINMIKESTNFMTSGITGKNIAWSIFSNSFRDLQTYIFYSKMNPVSALMKVGQSYVDAVKNYGGMKVSPFYSEYLAMGGGGAHYWGNENYVKQMRKKLAKKKQNLLTKTIMHPFEALQVLSDTIETGPRFAEYAHLRSKGVDQQEAFFAAMDITTNFRRGGKLTKDINMLFPFTNASVQGADHYIRFFTAEDMKGVKYTKGQRAKAAAGRTLSLIAVSAALAAITAALNMKDDDDKKYYKILSNYTKNSYYVIPAEEGGGRYIKIAKSRELSVLESLMERAIELYFTDNKHAFDEFYSYAADQLLPNIVSDLAKFPFILKDDGLSTALGDTVKGIIGSAGVAGVAAQLGFNSDFLGRPIVGQSFTVYNKVEPRRQYDDKTSQAAYLLGQALNISPLQIDFFMSNVMGYRWDYLASVFPIDAPDAKGTRDLTLGVKSKFNGDALYSNDLVNWMYDERDKSEVRANSYPDDMDAVIEAKIDGNLTQFYSNYNKLEPKTLTSKDRSVREEVLLEISDYRNFKDAYDEDGTLPKTFETVAKIVKDSGDTSLLPGVMDTKVKDSNKIEHTLMPLQYVEYQDSYNKYYYENVEDIITSSTRIADRPDLLRQCKDAAKIKATNDILEKNRWGTVDRSKDDVKKNIEQAALTETINEFRDKYDDNGQVSSAEKYELAFEFAKNHKAASAEDFFYDALTSDQKEKYDEWIDAGGDFEGYGDLMDISEIKADVGQNGKTISYSKKNKVASAILDADFNPTLAQMAWEMADYEGDYDDYYADSHYKYISSIAR